MANDVKTTRRARPAATARPRLGRGTTLRQVAADEVDRLSGRRSGIREARHFFRAAAVFVEAAEPGAVEAVAATLERAAAPAESTPVEVETVIAATGEPPAPAAEVALLETEALLRSFRWRREALAGSLTTPQVAALLGTSRQTPHDRARRGRLLGIKDHDALRFPAWQFDPAAPGGVLPGLPAVLGALRVSPLAKLSWLTSPRAELEGETPLAVLRRGEVDRLLPLARAVGVN